MSARVLISVGTLLGQPIYSAVDVVDEEVEATSTRLGLPCVRWPGNFGDVDEAVGFIATKIAGTAGAVLWIAMTMSELSVLRSGLFTPREIVAGLSGKAGP